MIFWSFFLRQWRSGSFNTIFFTIILAVTAAACITFFSTRLSATLDNEANTLIGADLILKDNQPINNTIREEISHFNVKTSDSLRTQSTLSNNIDFATISLFAAANNFPMRGKHKILQNGKQLDLDHGPAKGEIWLTEKTMQQLNVLEGDKINLGNSELTITAQLVQEVGSGFAMVQILPTAMISLQDMATTGLVQVGSRLTYRLYMTGEADEVKKLKLHLENIISPTSILEDIQSSEPQLKQAITRSNYFFGTTTSLSLVLSILALSLATRHYLQKYTQQIAILRALGTTSKQISQLFILIFSLLALLAGIVGTVLGYLLHLFLLGQAQAMLTVEKIQPAPLWIWWLMPLFAIFLVLGLIYPHIRSLRDISALRVLRDDLPLPKHQLLSNCVLFAIIIFAGSLQLGEIKLSLWFMGGLLATAITISLLAYLLIKLSQKLAHLGKIAWRQAIANLMRRPGLCILQITTLGISLLCLMTITMVKSDILQAWDSKIQDDTPNYFVLGVQQGEKQQYSNIMQSLGINPGKIYPFSLARLTHINNQSINIDDYSEQDARLLKREFSLSWLDDMPAHNQLASGQFWQKNTSTAQFSVEQDFAKRFNLKLGDILEFDIAGMSYSAPITNFRKVQWDSFQVNFFAFGTIAMSQEAPISYINSFYLPLDKKSDLSQLNQEMPHISIVDITLLLDTVKQMMQRISATINAMFLLSILATAMIIWTSLLFARDERIFDTALLRAIGASNQLIRNSLLIELALIGGFAGLISALLSNILSSSLSYWLFNIDVSINLWILPICMLLGITLSLLNGYPILRTVLNTPPRTILEERF